MPDIVRLRYVGAAPAAVPSLACEVKPDRIYELPGKVLTEHIPPGADKPEPVDEAADHYLIESGNPPQVQAWPKSMWRNETAKKSKE